MANIELVIKIPEEVYEEYKGKTLDRWNHSQLAIYIANGTPIPKGHDIIDGTELNKYLDDLIYAEQKIRLDGYETRTDIIERIKIKADYLTIIEADKGK